MVEFPLSPRAPPAVLAVVAMHGLTDARAPNSLFPYLLTFVPLPGSTVTTAFLAASVAHFSDDLGQKRSLLLHAAWATTALAFGLDTAFDAAVCYMAIVHVPMHYRRILQERTRPAFLSVLSASAMGCLVTPFLPARVTLTHLHQRLVVSHVLCERLRSYLDLGVSFRPWP